MRNYFLKMFYALLVLLLLRTSSSTLGFNLPSKISEQVKCIERERQALLNFVQGLDDLYGKLSTWKGGDCCKWRGIECNNETGHVLTLDLRGHNLQYLRGAINITPLIDLHYLEYLDLSYSDFLHSYIPELMGSFTKLRYLNLSYSNFYERIPYQLGNLSQLQHLDLGGNYYLSGVIPLQIGNLRQLRYLDLGGNSLYGAIPYQIGNLSELQYLDLGGNSFSGAIPFQIGNLPILNTLRLGGDFDVQTKDAEWFSNLHSLTNLELRSFPNLGSSHRWLQRISKLIPNLRELRLVECSLLDYDIPSLFRFHSNFSTSLTILDLSYNMLTSSTFQLLSNNSLNLEELYLSNNNFVLSSLLYPNFPSLVTLDLSFNNLTLSMLQDNFNFSSKLQKLYLQNCSLLDRSFLVPPAFSMNFSSSLVSLDLSYNLLTSSAIFHWLFNFTTNLRSLYLFGNLLEGPIPEEFGKVMNSLEYLDLSSNKLQGEIPTSFGNMCSLQTLYLSNNTLSGDLSSFMQNSSCCILQTLDISYNRITGMIPKSIGLLSELEDLSLRGNSLEGDVTESHLSNFSKLTELDLSYSSLSLKFGSSWVPPFKLRYLYLASCKLGPSFPRWLQTQSFLFYLDISDAGINDIVPEWFWDNSQSIKWMNMSHNSLTGAIPNLPFKLPIKPSISLNSNQFGGAVPSFLLQASELTLSHNNFSDLFSFLCDKSATANLATLDLSNNQIKGQLPDCWKYVNSLLFLDLSNNKLSGRIPPSMGTLVNLEVLVLRNNSLMGELPSTLKNCSNLIMLDVGENLLSGPIPSWIGENMQQLIILSIRGNGLSGNLPIHLCYLRHIQLLDLSRNNLSEGIPTCINNFTAMSEKSINSSETQSHILWHTSAYLEIYSTSKLGDYKLNITLTWKGVEHGFKDPQMSLKSIDFSSNNLNGEIPKEVGYLLGLVSLNLSRNNLSGEIPPEIGNLSFLEFLDLSRNHFSGKIPSTLSKIDDLGVLDLSNNSLSGRIPFGRQLQTFDASSFEGNLNLCGEQLNKTCPEDETKGKPQGSAVHGENDNSAFYEALYMSMGLGFFTGFWGLLGPILLWRPWRIAYIRFLNRLTDYVYVMIAVNMTRCRRWLTG
ncbi:receptor-like protein EIX2 isoform X1 [Gastrolobium bilobum]|uniref:receptor-like protein EIX2 isoform X1 n=1 Tax=Gastrolobium bilobum TaxID=150636 RepID=UPI002AAF32EC|nr:receptor-like protein EIX2 isoform X1 [Gastrolobium bilobum]XP_061376149.1 receptor-like protein EIX2 isoform X1 [Gastrolobium bilobum]